MDYNQMITTVIVQSQGIGRRRKARKAEAADSAAPQTRKLRQARRWRMVYAARCARTEP